MSARCSRSPVRGCPAGEALPWGLLDDLSRLVDCDRLRVSGQDTPRWEFFAHQELALSWSPAQGRAYDAAYRRHYWESTCSYPDRTGDVVSVTRDSDLQADREYRNTALVSRGPGPGFSDRDLAVLTLLRPHLQPPTTPPSAGAGLRCP